MTWTPDIIRARFIEACDTERRLPAGGIGQRSGFWPAFVHTFEDMSGWGTKRLAEERELRARSSPPSAAAISRHLECLQWTAELMQDERKRRLVWAWAFCQVTNRSFAEHCRKNGFVKMTAYRRLSASFQDMCEKLCNNRALLREPDEKWLLPNQQFDATEEAPYHCSAGATPQAFISEKSADLLKTPEAIACFESFLRKTNRQRRKAQQPRVTSGGLA